MNSGFSKLLLAAFSASLTFSVPLRADVVSATIQTPPPAESGYFKFGTATNPAGDEISVNSRSLLFDGQPWVSGHGRISLLARSRQMNGAKNCSR